MIPQLEGTKDLLKVTPDENLKRELMLQVPAIEISKLLFIFAFKCLIPSDSVCQFITASIFFV